MPSNQAKQDIKNFNASFYGDAPAVSRVTPGDIGRTLVPSLSKWQVRLQGKVEELHRHMLDVGIRPATMVSIRPLPINSQGLHACNYPIAACPIGNPEVPYVKMIIPSFEVDYKTDEHGEWDVRAEVAIKIAEDVKQQLNKVEPGRRGLIIYMGDRDPDKYVPDPYQADKRNLVEELAEEKEAMIREFFHYFEIAEGYAGSSSKIELRHITDLHRIGTRYLYHEKRIKQLPTWVTEQRELRDIGNSCICGAEVPHGALKCAKCGDWVNPYEAYLQNRLSLRDDGALTALGRLTKEQLTELKLYPHIRPNSEMNDDMIKDMLKTQIAELEAKEIKEAKGKKEPEKKS